MATLKCTPENPCGVLIIEDDVILQNTFRALAQELYSVGLHAEIVAGVAAARLLIKSCVFEVVLLDLNLEETKGMETIKAMRPLLDCPIFGFTGYYDRALHDVYISHGVEDIFIKTEVSLQLLIRLLKWAASQHRTLLHFKGRAEAAENQLREYAAERTTDEVLRLDPIINGLHEMAATGR